MGDVTPIRPVPDDGEIVQYLVELIGIDSEESHHIKTELTETLLDTVMKGEPTEFAYGKLLNKLKTFKKEELAHMLAATMWRGLM